MSTVKRQKGKTLHCPVCHGCNLDWRKNMISGEILYTCLDCGKSLYVWWVDYGDGVREPTLERISNPSVKSPSTAYHFR